MWFWEARNIKKDGELMGVDILYLTNSLRLFKEPPIQTASAPTDTVSVESLCSLSVVLTSHEATTFLIWS